jgi:hypothetical protein
MSANWRDGPRRVRLRNLWRLVGSTERSVLPVVTVLLVAAVGVGAAFWREPIGWACLACATPVLLFCAGKAVVAEVCVADGDRLMFDTLGGVRSIDVRVARSSTVEDVSWGSRWCGLLIGAEPFWRQPLALMTEDEWERLLGSETDRSIALWKELRRPRPDPPRDTSRTQRARDRPPDQT